MVIVSTVYGIYGSHGFTNRTAELTIPFISLNTKRKSTCTYAASIATITNNNEITPIILNTSWSIKVSTSEKGGNISR